MADCTTSFCIISFVRKEEKYASQEGRRPRKEDPARAAREQFEDWHRRSVSFEFSKMLAFISSQLRHAERRQVVLLQRPFQERYAPMLKTNIRA